MATRARDLRHEAGSDTFFARVGAFLAEHHLSPEPDHYAFAYEVVVTGGELANRVAALTDGGFRLSSSDIADLGGTVHAGRPVDVATDGEPSAAAQSLVARALDQLTGVSDTIRAVHAETGDFGRDLRASADAMRTGNVAASAAEITRLTAAMIGRVQQAEDRLNAARQEAETLREELDEARGSARSDPLTELPNRRAFDEALAALAHDEEVVIAICDIDHFKSVNDGFGHMVGDRVLKVVAQTLAAEIGGTVARWGGEEFAVLFDHGDMDAAVATIDRARDALASRRLKVRETGEAIGTVTFSAGLALSESITDRHPALERADRALYHAKLDGRARTRVFS